jgi:hypothetical protein
MNTFSNPAFWIAIAGVVTAVTGLVKAFHAKDSADSAHALLELHTSEHVEGSPESAMSQFGNDPENRLDKPGQ